MLQVFFFLSLFPSHNLPPHCSPWTLAEGFVHMERKSRCSGNNKEEREAEGAELVLRQTCVMTSGVLLLRFTVVIPNINTFELDHLLQNICRSSCPVEFWLTGALVHKFLYQANCTIICTTISCDMMVHQSVLHCTSMLACFTLSNKDSKHC